MQPIKVGLASHSCRAGSRGAAASLTTPTVKADHSAGCRRQPSVPSVNVVVSSVAGSIPNSTPRRHANKLINSSRQEFYRDQLAMHHNGQQEPLATNRFTQLTFR